MIAFLLTTQQKNEIEGQLYAPNSYFNPIQDDKGNWVIFEEEVNGCINPEFIWVKTLPIIDYVLPSTTAIYTL